MAEELTVGEVLSKIYENLKSRKEDFLVRKVGLEQGAWSEVANDNDWHRSRAGVLIYNEALILTTDPLRWIVAHSSKTQGYPADQFDSDLIAIPYSQEEVEIEGIRDAINKSDYFRHSLLIGLYNGSLVLSNHPDNPFTQRMMASLKSDISDFIAKKPEVDHEHFFLDLRPVIKSPTFYKLEIVDYLENLVVGCLKDSKEEK